ncbi:MAG: hypothetical protein ACXAD7_05165 [Candidatus Kariarchaeaceae archaeon]|jgi:hypothetical protein
MSAGNSTNTTLLKIGALVLVVQNVMLMPGLFAAPDLAASFGFYIDIVGFLLVGIAFLLLSQDEDEDKSMVLLGGIGFLGWVVCRVFWQFILAEGLFDDTSGDADEEFLDNLVDTLIDMLWAFFISAIFLMVACFALWKAKKAGGALLAYGIINLIAVFLFVNPLIGQEADEADVGGMVVGFLMKLLLVPIFGIVAFLMMYRNADAIGAGEQL